MPRRRPLENILLGTDPECFIFNTKTNKVKSSVRLIPGTKDNPYKIPELGEGFALQTDNILAEFNIPPAKYVDDFISSINKMKEYIRNYVKNINPDYDILCASSQNVPKSELRSKQAREYGCDPDYCVYTGTVNPKPEDATKSTIRGAGFHIHIGYDAPEIDRSLRLITYLDAYLGLPSILIDKDTERRKLYGQAGCFRLTKYGCEYRTLSSFFMKDDKHLRWVLEQVNKAISAYNDCVEIPPMEITQEVINTNNTELAKKICERYKICSNFLTEE